MDQLEAMNVLLAVAESGGFTAAGRRLGMPLPTVSRKLAELEAHLGTRLLNRTTRRVTLTDAGTSYVAACRRILEEIAAADRRATGEYVAPKGDLVITAPVVFGRLHVVPVVTNFLTTYPDINVRLILSDRNAQLLDDHIDIAVRVGSLPDSSMMALYVGTVRQIVCGSPSYFEKYGVPKKPSNLSGMPCVTFEALGSSATWSFVRSGRRITSVPIVSRLSVNTAEAAIDAAIAGLGVTRILSYQVAKAVASGTLETVLADFEPEPLPINLLYATGGTLPLKLRAFLDFAANSLRAALHS